MFPNKPAGSEETVQFDKEPTPVLSVRIRFIVRHARAHLRLQELNRLAFPQQAHPVLLVIIGIRARVRALLARLGVMAAPKQQVALEEPGATVAVFRCGKFVVNCSDVRRPGNGAGASNGVAVVSTGEHQSWQGLHTGQIRLDRIWVAATD